MEEHDDPTPETTSDDREPEELEDLELDEQDEEITERVRGGARRISIP